MALVPTPATEVRTYSWPRMPGRTKRSDAASNRVARAYSTSTGSWMSMSSSTRMIMLRSLRAPKAATAALRPHPSSRSDRFDSAITRWNRWSPPEGMHTSVTIGVTGRTASRAATSSTCLRSTIVSRPAPLMAWYTGSRRAVTAVTSTMGANPAGEA